MCRSAPTVLCLLIAVHLAMSACPDIVSRSQWSASSPRKRTPMPSLPVPFVLIHHTYQPGFCNTSTSCERSMRGMQNYHKNDQKWDDIGYHFCIGGAGQVYQGRGWDVVGTHAPNYNSRSIGICFIGDYTNELPTAEMLEAAKSLIECGVERESIAANYTLLGHRQVRSTECPGNSLFNEIKTWPHWTDLETRPSACPEIVSRADWGAAPAVSSQMLTSLPVPFVLVHHTVQPGACNTSDSCKTAMRSMQRNHQNVKHWNDIGYQFCIGGTGKVYEGRGWDVVGSHAPNYNSRSTGICFIGDYRTELPTPEMLNAAKSLIACGVELGSISADYKLLGHRQVRTTECPGGALYNEIQTWPHWEALGTSTST